MQIQEQERLYEKEMFLMEQVYERSINKVNNKESFDNISMRISPKFQFPMGFKQQIAAQKVQKYLKGFLVRKRINLGQIRNNNQISKYKRHNIECQYCQEKFTNKSNLVKHITFMHQNSQNELQLKSFSLSDKNFKPSQQQTSSFQKQTSKDESKKETIDISNQIKTPYKKLRVSKKQYQQWSGKIQSQYQSLNGHNMSFKSPEFDKLIKGNEIYQQQQFNSICSIPDFKMQSCSAKRQNISYSSLNMKPESNQQISELMDNQNEDDLELKLSDYMISSIKKPSESKNIKESIDISPSLKSDLLKEFEKAKNIKNQNVPNLLNLQNLHKIQMNKQLLNFTPKSYRLNQPVLYDFDIYIRAAIEIQRFFRGFKVRRRIFGSFKKFKQRIIQIQRVIRQYLKRKRLRYQQYLDYLEIKSKKIVTNLKNFYKVIYIKLKHQIGAIEI